MLIGAISGSYNLVEILRSRSSGSCKNHLPEHSVHRLTVRFALQPEHGASLLGLDRFADASGRQ